MQLKHIKLKSILDSYKSYLKIISLIIKLYINIINKNEKNHITFIIKHLFFHRTKQKEVHNYELG